MAALNILSFFIVLNSAKNVDFIFKQTFYRREAKAINHVRDVCWCVSGGGASREK